MEIKLLHRDQIDIEQWDARVAQSGNGLPYALSAYLDVVTHRNWSALVGGDYEAIFPLPIERKLGLSMYLQPPFTQQLGLIAKDYDLMLLLDFLNAIPRDVYKVHLKGNESESINIHNKYEIKVRTNLLLDLNRGYDLINAGYSKSLRKRIRKSKEHYKIIESNDVELLVSFYQTEMNAKVGLKSSQYDTAKKLFQYLIDVNIGMIYLAKNEENIDGALFVIRYQNRIINLFGSSNVSGKKHFAMHLILDHIIELNSESNKIFDFEGSDLAGVKEFYESFGPDRFTYPEYYRDNSPMWLKVAKVAVKKVKGMIS